MIKKLLIGIVLSLCLATMSLGAGLTVSVLTEQVVSVNSDNAINARIGYYLGGENGGLEPFIGCTWFPREDSPQVIALGALQHAGDILDPNSPIPILPGLLLAVITEEAVMRPYIGGVCTINLLDRDAGYIEAVAGVSIMLSPDANSSLEFETSYGSMFGDLSGRDDYEFRYRLGFKIPFKK